MPVITSTIKQIMIEDTQNDLTYRVQTSFEDVNWFAITCEEDDATFNISRDTIMAMAKAILKEISE